LFFGRSIELFKVFGFPIRLDPSWFIVAVLLTWTFATNIFPPQVPGLSPAAYWGMGVAGAIGLLA